MAKTLTRHGNSLALVIEKPILELLKIDEHTPLELDTDGDMLIVKPQRDAERTAKLREVLEEGGAFHLLDSPLQSVPGGEMQRILLARAPLRDPQLLVLDEPVQVVDGN